MSLSRELYGATIDFITQSSSLQLIFLFSFPFLSFPSHMFVTLDVNYLFVRGGKLLSFYCILFDILTELN